MGMKLSVSTYSYLRLIDSGKMTQLECIKKSKELGFDGVEICWDEHLANGKPEEYACSIAEEAAKQGIKISNFVFGADFIANDLKSETGRVKSIIKLAKLCGAPSVRHDAFGSVGKYRSFAKALNVAAPAIREVSLFGAELGLFTMVENHGFVMNTPERMEALYNKVDCENFGLLGDMGNFLCTDSDPAYAIGTIAPMVRCVHAKDFLVKNEPELNPGRGFFRSRGGKYLRGTIIGHGAVPVAGCLYALAKEGYKGYVTIEFEGMEDPIDAASIGLENIKGYLENLEEV